MNGLIPLIRTVTKPHEGEYKGTQNDFFHLVLGHLFYPANRELNNVS